MDWYYVENGSPRGPVSLDDLANLRTSGKLPESAIVWKAGMAGWEPVDVVIKRENPGPAAAFLRPTISFAGEAKKLEHLATIPTLNSSGHQEQPREAPRSGSIEGLEFLNFSCCECGRSFSQEDLLVYEGLKVCGECKPLFIQKVIEGAIRPHMEYAGVITRFLSLYLDLMLVSVVLLPVNGTYEYFNISNKLDPFVNLGMSLAISALGQLVHLAYIFVCLLFWDGTVGQLMCGTKMVRGNTGERVKPGLAFCVACTNILMTFSCNLAMVTAFWDPEKRFLTDYLTDTRVVYNRK